MSEQTRLADTTDAQAPQQLRHAVAWSTLFSDTGYVDWTMYDAVYDVSVSQVRRLAESELEVDA